MSLNNSVLAVHLMPSSFLNGDTNGSPTNPFIENGYASTAFQIICSALVMVMIPAVGLLYGSFAEKKNVLTILQISMLSYAVVCLQYVLIGFSLSFSETSSLFLGDMYHFAFMNVDWTALTLTAPALPGIVFALYQMQFAAITVALCFGSVIERVRVVPCIVFAAVWTTLIYDPIVFWTWSARGFLRNLACPSTALLANSPCQIGAIDFAGGGPIHISSGAAALAFCIFVGPRKGVLERKEESKPTNPLMNFAATALLWFGWFGFNAGSALDATPRAAHAGVLTTVAASAGALTWVALDYWHTGKLSTNAFNAGAIAGLVGITPASGYVPVWSSILIGAITATCCFHGVKLKVRFSYDDATDSFGIHGIGGFVGSILTAVFASKAVAKLDATVIEGGPLMDGRFEVVLYNIVTAIIILFYSYLGTFAILTSMERFAPVALKFRISEEEELEGQDLYELGESVDSLASSIHAQRQQLNASKLPFHGHQSSVFKSAATGSIKQSNDFIELQEVAQE